MKIALAHPDMSGGGGAEYLIGKVLEHLRDRHEVHLYTASKYELDGVETHRLGGTLGFRNLFSLVPTFSALKLHGFDVINAYSPPSHYVALRNNNVLWYYNHGWRFAYDLLPYFKKKQRTGIRLHAKVNLVKKLDSLAVPRIKEILANSVNTAERVKQFHNREATVCYPAIDYGEYEEGDYQKYFLYVSRFTPEKRQLEVIRAFKQAHLKDYKLVLAGGLSPNFSRYYAQLKEEAGKNVAFITSVSKEEKLRLISNCFAGIFVPVDEDFGLVPLEYSACGKATIAVDEGGCRETVWNGETGFLCNPVNLVDELAGKMREFAGNPDRAEEMGKKASKLVKKKFNWENFYGIYDRALKNSSKI